MRKILFLIFAFSSCVFAKGPATSNILYTGVGIAEPGAYMGMNPAGVMHNKGPSLVLFGWKMGSGTGGTPWAAGFATGGGKYGGEIIASGTAASSGSSSSTSTTVAVGADLGNLAVGLSSQGSGAASTIGFIFNTNSKNRFGLIGTSASSSGSSSSSTVGLGYSYVTNSAAFALDVTNTASTKSGLVAGGFSVHGDRFQFSLSMNQAYYDPATGSSSSGTDSIVGLGYLFGSSGLLMLMGSSTGTNMLGLAYLF